ncbi:carbohydrate kinase [Escherichia coli]|uniref:Carbohydrate kinase n=1 Tax=Escherichia coli TaxID=562 RepID=A0A376TXU9_ECOLX|nr:carbohydrate kinase [Escherichia coli]
MPDNSAAIVIDIGTTNCKVTCFSCLDATTLGAHKFVTAKQISPQGDVDFDIDALWQEVRQAIAQLNAASPLPVRRISIASFGESGVFLDEHGEILTPMLAWYDRRGEEYLATLSEADSAALYDICGLPLTAITLPSKCAGCWNITRCVIAAACAGYMRRKCCSGG